LNNIANYGDMMYKLLIVDDEPIIRRGIKTLAILPEIGIDEIFEAGNADKCLEIVDKEHIDIIMLDINMPNTDGLSLAKILKEKNKKIAIIMITGYDYFEYMQTAIRIGVDDYLLKPVNKTDIELVLRRIIDKIKTNIVKDKLMELHLEYENISYDNSSFKAVKEYMEKNIFDSKLSLGLMAEELGFNSSYLSGIIKQIYGIPFQEYVGIKRMEQAKILCLSTDMKNYEIAEKIGYDDVNYFTNKFKKMIDEALSKKDYDIIWLETAFCTGYAEYIKEKKPLVKIVSRSHNVESLLLERIASEEKNFIKRYLIKREAVFWKEIEFENLKHVDKLLTITQNDAEYFLEKDESLKTKTEVLLP